MAAQDRERVWFVYTSFERSLLGSSYESFLTYNNVSDCLGLRS